MGLTPSVHLQCTAGSLSSRASDRPHLRTKSTRAQRDCGRRRSLEHRPVDGGEADPVLVVVQRGQVACRHEVGLHLHLRCQCCSVTLPLQPTALAVAAGSCGPLLWCQQLRASPVQELCTAPRRTCSWSEKYVARVAFTAAHLQQRGAPLTASRGCRRPCRKVQAELTAVCGSIQHEMAEQVQAAATAAHCCEADCHVAGSVLSR